MRNLPIFILTPLLLCLCLSLSAQRTATWQGGKPGRATEWTCAANWKEGRVPDEFTQVIIPTRAAHSPIIQNTAALIDALLMEGGTTLTIKDGAMLTVLCETGIFDGVTLLGQIRNDGILQIQGEAGANTALLLSVKGSGVLLNADTLSLKY
jgi:hypothetical protein